MNENLLILKKYRYLTLLLGLLLMAMILAGCSDDRMQVTETEIADPSPTPTRRITRTPAPVPTQQPPVYLQITPEVLAGTVVHFAHPWIGEMAEVMKSIALEYSLSNEWDIWVEADGYGGEMAMVEAIRADLEVGEAPGLIAAHPYLLAELDGDYFPVNLTNYFADEVWGFDADDQDDILPLFLEQFTEGDELIALPFAPQATVLFYNQTWGKTLGFDQAPADEDTFREQACGATFANLEDDNEENDGLGGWVINTDPNVMLTWYGAFNGEIPLYQTPVFDTNTGQKMFGYLKALYDEGCIWIGRQPEHYFYFANRDALMVASTLDQIPSQLGWMAVAENKDAWSVVGFPGSAGEVILVDGPGLVITVDSPENQMAAWLFARYLLEPDVQARLVRTGFTLPVRDTALSQLGDFIADYPQWAQAVDLMDTAIPAPVMPAGWGLGRWVLQDAAIRIFQLEADQIPLTLEELDVLIAELEGMAP